MGFFTRKAASCKWVLGTIPIPGISWHSQGHGKLVLEGEKGKIIHDLVHHKRLSTYETGPKSFPEVASVGTAQEPTPWDQWGDRMA